MLESNWEEKKDSYTSDSFSYPDNFSTKYASPVDWPPQIIRMNVPFTCNETSDQSQSRGINTIQKSIQGREYCITTSVQESTGNFYLQKKYAFPTREGKATLSFSLRKDKCDKYQGSEKDLCSQEQESLKIDLVVHKIVDSFIDK